MAIISNHSALFQQSMAFAFGMQKFVNLMLVVNLPLWRLSLDLQYFESELL